MAHLLEHMLFKGTPTHPFIPKELQEHGATFNGSTTSDRVNYYETLADIGTNLEFAIALEADRMVNSTIKKEDLDSEMTVVRNEFERGENSPQGVLMERIQEVAYDWHNYGKPTIGNRTDIERVPVENLRAFYRKYYQPDNIVLVVAGKFEESKGLELVQKYFGPIPRPARKLDTTWTEEPPQDGERSVTLRRVGELAVVGVAYHVPAAPHEDLAALEVLANILSSQPSGRLYKALVETKKASSAFASARAEHDPGLMMMSAQVTQDSSPEEVRDILLATVEGVGAGGVTAEEVNRARQQILRARERTATDTTRIGVSLSTWIAQGDWRLYFLDRDRVEKVTPEAVQTVAAHYLQRNNRTVGLFIPTDKAERVAIPATPDLAALVADYKGRPPLADGEFFDATPANVEARVQRQELPEGIKVTLLPKKTRGSEVHVTLLLHFGNEENLKGLQAAGEFLPRLMQRETKQLDQQHLRDKLDELGATLNGGGSLGEVSFSIQAKQDTLPAALEILRQVLREPALPADQFEVLKRLQLASLERSRTEPDALAARALSRELHPYPKDDIRYVPTIDEEIDRVKNTTCDQVAQLYRGYLGSQTGELTIVGDFDAGACLPVLKAALAGWKAAKPYTRILPRPPRRRRRERNTPSTRRTRPTPLTRRAWSLP
jgi:zinc protease